MGMEIAPWEGAILGLMCAVSNSGRIPLMPPTIVQVSVWDQKPGSSRDSKNLSNGGPTTETIYRSA